MKLEYKIDEDDFLTYYLFNASKSDRIRKKRIKNKIFIPIIYISIGIFFYFQLGVTSTFLLIIFGILWFFIYPYWERRHYKNHYQGFIKENLKNRLDSIGTIEITNDYFLGKDNGSESKILTIEIEEIFEIPTLIFVKLKSGQSFLFPKNKISEIDALRTRLKELATYLGINYILDEKWKWK